MAADWQQVKALFDEAMSLASGERQAFLAAVTADAAVRAEVLSLVAHAADDADLAAPAPPPATPLDGQRLGAWIVTGTLGSGGMGEVLRARRADGAYDGEAAIKVLKRGMDSEQLLARFAQEQRALARLNHPHIARLFDAGLTPDHRPYFVMELIEGQPIDRAVEGLPIEARLGVFLQLADAVAYAHRQLLVHRDLKPSNVLVDNAGQVKLLDFGIAKALDPHEGGAQRTQADERPFTPLYASPEQVRGELVSTATDLYSLGVLLYVLLTGQRPYARGLTSAAEVARSVLEESPTRPSALSPGLAADPGWLANRRRLRGDLDNILLKALEKPVERRYPSVDALAADLRACLGGYPVSARAPSWSYVAGRFALRHRVSVAIAALGAVGIVAALVTALWQAHRADLARAQAERRFSEVRRLANGLVFRYHDQIAHLPGSTATREALLADAVRYLDGLREGGEASLDAGLAREAAESYFRIATLQGEQFSPSQERLAEAEVNLGKALALLPRYIEQPAVPLDALFTAADMWLARHSQLARGARLRASVDALDAARSVALRAQQRAPDDPQVLSRLASIEGRIGTVQGGSAVGANLGRVDDALASLTRAEALMAELQRQQPERAEWMHQHAWACQNLANVLIVAGRHDEALPWSLRSVELRDAAAAREPANAHYRQQRATARLLAAFTRSQLGQHAQAIALLDEGVSLLRAVAAADADNRVAARDLLVSDLARGRTLAHAGQAAQARSVLERFLAQVQPPQAGSAPDFYRARLRAEALIWHARVQPAGEAAVALRSAEEAAALMAPDPAEADNASRAWAYALALGEAAAAHAAAGRVQAARGSAQAALAAWHAAPGGRAPGLYARWQARDEALAAGSGR